MKQTHLSESPLAPAQPTVSGSTTTPVIILRGLITMFSEPGGNHADRAAALELDTLFMLDASAERDLLDSLFGNHDFDASTPVGMNQMLNVLQNVGAVEMNSKPNTTSEIFGLKFHARPLLNLLKAMPNRDGGMGLSLNLVENRTEKSN